MPGAMVITAEEIAVAVVENPLLKVADNPSRFRIVLGDPADARCRPLKENWGQEKLALGTRVAILAPTASPRATRPAVSKSARNALTARNWAILLKLHTLIANGK